VLLQLLWISRSNKKNPCNQCPSILLTEIPTFTTRCFNTRRYICTIYFTYVDTICTALGCLNKGNFPMVSIVMRCPSSCYHCLYTEISIKETMLTGLRISTGCHWQQMWTEGHVCSLFVEKLGYPQDLSNLWDGHPYNFLGNLRSIKFNALLTLQRLHQCSNRNSFEWNKKKN